jgi:hypothetical protein
MLENSLSNTCCVVSSKIRVEVGFKYSSRTGWNLGTKGFDRNLDRS